MGVFNLIKEVESAEKRIDNLDYILGKGLMQPFRNTNSSSRCIMQGIQKEQTMECIGAEPPIIQTGYETKFGEMSSSYITAKSNYVVIDKIAKYPTDSSRFRKYIILLLDIEKGELSHVERTGYVHISESYGYTFNNKYMDSLSVGDMISKDTPIKKSSGFDDNNNRRDGVNLSTIYMAGGFTTEDPIILSESAAAKFASPLFNSVTIVVNDNDILLNLYGNDKVYKAFPYIGEETKDGILCAVRREKKDEEALFAQSWKNLREIMVSDEKYVVSGKVIDVEVNCNNQDSLHKIHNSQILEYYQANKDYCYKIVESIDSVIKNSKIKMEYQTAKLYYNAKKVIDDVPYINEKVFNNIIMKLTVMRMIPLIKGDKITDRYGGKGVISLILPDELMPKKLNFRGEWEPIDAWYNSSTCVNRENPGQLFETSVTFIGEQIVEYIANQHKMPPEQAANMVEHFLSIVSPNQAVRFRKDFESMADYEEKYMFIQSIINLGNIYCAIKPLNDPMSLDKISELYDAFPFVQQRPIMTVIKDSNGNLRNIISRRPLTVGTKYIYRLKQFAEEKFSAVSLAATNIRGENSKTKASKQHKILFSSTPVRFGEMEWGDLIHIQAVEQVIQVLMLLSSSPGARKLMANLLTDDPFNVDIKLDGDSISRSAEIVATYLKTIGLAIVVERIPKKKSRPLRLAISRIPGKNILKEVIEKTPFEVLEEDIYNVTNAMIDSSKYKVPVLEKIDSSKYSLEEAEILLKDMITSRAIRVINQYAKLQGAKSVKDVIKLIEDSKSKPIDIEQRIRPVSRIVVSKIPDNNE